MLYSGLKHRYVQLGVFGFLLAVLLVYSQTVAFHWDEGFHLLAARFISSGKRPYLDFLFAQAPLNAYWTGAWFRVLHPSWRLAHVLAAFETWAAVVLMARYQWKRFPIAEFRVAAALTMVALFGLLTLTFNFGAIAQAYAFCLLMVVGAFRVCVVARERPGLWAPALAGALAAGAAAASLLTAAILPVMLVWLWFSDLTRRRWSKSAAFAVGALLPVIPVLRLLAVGPQQVWFNLVQYHALYRRVDWAGATTHDIDVLSYWIQDSQELILIGLAVAGWLAVRREEWAAKRRAEFYLASWLVAGVFAQNALAHPTFPQYFIFAVPFLALLASAGFYKLVLRLNLANQPERSAAVLCCFMLASLGRGIFQGRDYESWQVLMAAAQKVNQVTPAHALVMTQEPIYFLSGREVPYGMEFDFAHKLDLGPQRNALFHIVPRAELDRQIKAGRFATAALCDDDDQIANIKQWNVYSQKFEKGDCTVFWQPNVKSASQYPQPGS